MTSSFCPLLILSFLCTVTVNRVVDSLILEDGYIVSRIFDGNKQHVNPYLILPQFGSSDFIILDSSRSAFYSLSFPSPKESVIKKLAGNGTAGYADGELGSAMFHKPKNFAVDYKGNIYVADQYNQVIRKISKSGVTTIAGGNSHTSGNKDGLAQNATFSDDFELTFIPERCALMISDHGNSLIRQINLKAEDCPHGSHSGLGMSTAWALGLGLSCLLLGLIVGFVSRPYVITRGGMRLLPWKGTWRYCLMSLVRQVRMLCSDIRSALVSSSKSSERAKAKLDQLKDLISFDDGVESLGMNLNNEPKDGGEGNTDVSVASNCSSKIEKMIQANIMGFPEQARKTSAVKSLECNAGLVKRK